MPDFHVKGNPGAIRSRADLAVQKGQAFFDTGAALAKITTDGWTGRAAEKWIEAADAEPERWTKAGNGFVRAGNALNVYATALENAQSTADWAKDEYARGEQVTDDAKSSYDSDVSQAKATANSYISRGIPYDLTIYPFDDPGEEIRQNAVSEFEKAKGTLENAAGVCAGEVKAGCRDAPEEPNWLESGLKFVGGVFAGAGEALWDLAKLTAIVPGSPMFFYELTNTLGDLASGELTPEEWAKQQELKLDMAQDTFKALKDDPMEFGKNLGKALIDWDTWTDDPARAIGHLVPDAVAAVFTGGTSAAVTRGTKGISDLAGALSALGRHGDDLAGGLGNLGRHADDLGGLGDIGRHADDLPGGNGPGGLDDIPGGGHTPDAPDAPRSPHNPDTPGSPEGPRRTPDGNDPPHPPDGNDPPRTPDGNDPPRTPDGNDPPRTPDGNDPPRTPDGNDPPREPDPNDGSPQGPESDAPDPNNPDPDAPDPNSPDPNSPDPNAPDPDAPDPNSPDPNAPDPDAPPPGEVSPKYDDVPDPPYDGQGLHHPATDAWVDEVHRLHPELSKDQIRGMWDYTTSDGFRMNAEMRDLSPHTPETQEMIQHARDGLDRLPDFDGTTYRGTNLPQSVLDDILNKGVYRDDAFVSSTLDKSVIDGFYDRGGSNPARITMDGHSGSDVRPFSAHQGEAEILFDGGIPFEVVGKPTLGPDGVWDIHVREPK